MHHLASALKRSCYVTLDLVEESYDVPKSGFT
jgi:hypothetical protein